jgi:hypothetical protein
MVDPMVKVLRSGIGLLPFVCSRVAVTCRSEIGRFAGCLIHAINGNYATETP